MSKHTDKRTNATNVPVHPGPSDTNSEPLVKRNHEKESRYFGGSADKVLFPSSAV